MRNNKGQTLIEFVLILPIFLLVLISLVDVSNIMYKKHMLLNDLDTISSMYEEKDQESIDKYVLDNNLKINYKQQDKLEKITISKDVKVISPMVNVVLGKNYTIEVSNNVYIKE